MHIVVTDAHQVQWDSLICINLSSFGVFDVLVFYIVLPACYLVLL